MSVSEVKISSVGVGGSATGTDAGSAKLTYRAAFRVKCSDTLDTAKQVYDHFMLTADLPWLGRVFHVANGFDVDAVCKSLVADPVPDSNGHFVVQATFEPEDGPGGEVGQTAGGEASEDPADWHDDIDVSYTQISQPVYDALFLGFDPPGIVNGHLAPGLRHAIVNSANIPLDPTIEAMVDITVVRISKYAAGFDDFQNRNYRNAINDAAGTISKPDYNFSVTFGQYEAKINAPGTTFLIANGIPCHRQTIEVHINPLTWAWKIVDKGMNRRTEPGDPNLDGAGGSYSEADFELGEPRHAPIKDADGYPISEPVLLDGKGQPLPAGRPPVYLKWITNPIISFAGINW